MWFNRHILGAGHASVLVSLGLQELRLPWRFNLGKWQHGGEASRKVEKEDFLEPLAKQSLSWAIVPRLESRSSSSSRHIGNLSDG
jgi:hypothetical protein